MPATIVLFIDGLSAHLLGPYGNTTVETPSLNRLAAESMLFDFCFAESPKLNDSYPLLFNGIDLEGSILVSDCPEVSAIAGRYSFDSIVDVRDVENRQLAADAAQTQAANFFAHAVESIETLDEHGLCWLHHRGLCGSWDAPWELRASFMGEDDPAPPDDIARPIGVFDVAGDDPDTLLGYQQSAYAQVVVLDQLLGAFLDHLQQADILDSVSLVFGSARGYPLGEHGFLGTFENVYSETLHVPLMIRRPRNNGARYGSRHQSLLQFRDVNRVMHGLADELIPSLPSHNTITSFAGDLHSYQNDQWKLICSDKEIQPAELYAKPDDRWEVNDVGRRCPEVVEELKSKLAIDQEKTRR